MRLAWLLYSTIIAASGTAEASPVCRLARGSGLVATAMPFRRGIPSLNKRTLLAQGKGVVKALKR